MRNRKLLLSMVIVFFAVMMFIAAGCNNSNDDQSIFNPTPTPGVTKDWTVLVYIAGDNNLEAAGLLNINQMEQVGSTDNVNIVVEYDRNGEYDSSLDWTGCRRYYINKADNPGQINSTLLQDLGQTDTGDVNQFVDFVEWGATEYPADRYMVIMWDHGSGWRAKELKNSKGICYDDTSGNHITENQMRDGLAQIETFLGKKIELVAMDGCQMAHIEVAYDVMNSANYLVFSEQNVPFDGLPYHLFLADLVANPTMNGATLGTSVVDNYISYYVNQGTTDVCLSCVNLNALSPVVTAVNNFATDAMGLMTTEKANLITARDNTAVIETSSADTKDLYEFMTQVKAVTNDATLQADATTVQTAMQDSIVANSTGTSSSTGHGYCIWLPDASQYSDSIDIYDAISFGSLEWKNFITSLVAQ
ncbi:MAG: clostripain-related cysteine peptidase [Firmicutes bacterium]|nr:clostripain-related cysteine peptidase [Bacillota bacterium]